MRIVPNDILTAGWQGGSKGLLHVQQENELKGACQFLMTDSICHSSL